MRIVGADEMHLMADEPLEADPDVGLDVLHDVADVEGPVGVGQRGGDEQALAGLADAARGVVAWRLLGHLGCEPSGLESLEV